MKQFSTKEKTAYGLGAVGKDMVYALSSLNFQKYYPFNQNSPMERTRGLLSLLLLFLHIAKLHT